MDYRIYIDESGTHDEKWLVIGMLFVPDHGALHAELCAHKDATGYLNRSPKHKEKYRETHFKELSSGTDEKLAKLWLDTFIKHNCFFRAVVIDWSIFDGKHFGDPFEPAALKKRRAYKKWAEMLLHGEVASGNIHNARLYLDHLRIMYGYDIIPHLKDRFTDGYEGKNPYIKDFQHTNSRKDANQCLQLCDMLTACLYQQLVPSKSEKKLAVRNYLATVLQPFGVKRFEPSFWKGFANSTLRDHFPKYSAWFWRPNPEGKEIRRNKRRHRK